MDRQSLNSATTAPLLSNAMPPPESDFAEEGPQLHGFEWRQERPSTRSTATAPVDSTSSQRQPCTPRAPSPEEAPAPAGALQDAAPAPTNTKPLSKNATYLYTVSHLIFFAILGTLARLGLQALTFYTGAPVITGVLWANVTGSLVMGFLVEDKILFKEEWGAHNSSAPGQKAIKKTIPLYIGLTTGFCGCCTSFSSFIRDVFLALSNSLPDPSLDSSIPSRSGGYSFMALVAVILLTVSLSLSALIFGAHLALALGPYTPVISFRLTRRFLDPAMVFLGWGCWLGAVFMAIWPPDRNIAVENWRGRAVFAIVFAPVGCLLRFYVSLHLNTRIPAFPVGTFVVNMFGTGIEGLCFNLQHVGAIAGFAGSVTGCQVLQGAMDGFCGATTTVSTWVAELNGLSKRRHAYSYGIASITVALGLLVVIMGSLLWTRGFDTPVCG
ncbi:hypothetical protein N7478_013166 [Penicillium angulare]|uniref:uncharacterized protein n=1 Tax=Penicillium angulare TaxID=116970 RepID=UPI00253FCC4D|nr:uncharacterized protein N7478_013166 [Penicillium angulare]KAJ5257062.1 hypothetical protein N7478_013166 [Penicillium angulare]